MTIADRFDKNGIWHVQKCMQHVEALCEFKLNSESYPE